jgi:hypothetical protein
MCVHVLPLETRVAKFRVALPSKLRTSMDAVVAACEANCDPQGFLLALSAFSSAETNRSRTWSSIQKSFGAAVCCPLGTGGESLRCFCFRACVLVCFSFLTWFTGSIPASLSSPFIGAFTVMTWAVFIKALDSSLTSWIAPCPSAWRK